MRLRNLIFFILISSPLAFTQLTTVSGTVKDPSGLPYSLGTISAKLLISGSPRFPSGFPYTPPSAPVGLDTNGHFTMSLADVTQILPAGGTWSFHVCSATGTVQPGSPITAGPVCFDTTGLIISGSSQDISAPLSAAAPKLTAPGLGGGVSSINSATGALTFPNVSCTAPTCTLINPITLTPVTLPSLALQGVGGFGISSQTASTISPPSGTAWYWALNANSAGYGWQPLPYIVVNGVSPSGGVSAQNFNTTLPAPPANGINVTWQRAFNATGFSQQISAALVGDGSTKCLVGNGTYLPCALTLTATGTCVASATTTCSVTFTPPFPSSVQACVLTPETSGITSYFVSAKSTTGFTVTFAPSATATFDYICTGI